VINLGKSDYNKQNQNLTSPKGFDLLWQCFHEWRRSYLGTSTYSWVHNLKRF